MKILPQLPQEIIANILSRLPVKHLMQLKCVSKPWRSLISDPHFAKLHLAAQPLNYRVLLLTEPLESAACEASADDLEDIESNMILELQFPATMKETPDSDELLVEGLTYLASCNGLICATFGHQRICLWNPTIREAKELAKLSDFDPKGTFNYGLGYDLSIDDYKIVRTARSSTANDSDEDQVEVLTLKSNTWRRIQGLPPGIKINGPNAGIFLHGAVHWLAETSKTGTKRTYGIVAFDMLEEKFHELVPIPDQIEESNYHTLVLGISRDCLCLFFGCGYVDFFQAWLLKEHGIKSSWTRLFNVEEDMLYGHKYWENALCYTKSGKVVIDYDGRELAWYDPKEKTSKTFRPRNEWDWFSPVIYIESLVSPNSCSATNM